MFKKLISIFMIVSFLIVSTTTVLADDKTQDEIDEDRKQAAIVAVGVIAVLGSIWLLTHWNSSDSKEFLDSFTNKQLNNNKHLYLKLDFDGFNSSLPMQNNFPDEQECTPVPVMKLVYTW